MQFVLPSPKIKAAIISVSNKNNGGHTLYRLLPFCNADFFSLAVRCLHRFKSTLIVDASDALYVAFPVY